MQIRTELPEYMVIPFKLRQVAAPSRFLPWRRFLPQRGDLLPGRALTNVQNAV